MNLREKIAVITGGSKGIGLALAKELDKEGMKLVLVAKSQDGLKEAAGQLSGTDHTYFACDLSDIREVKKLAQKIKENFDRIDVLVNGAGIGVYKPIEEVSFEEWKSSFSIGVDAPFFLTQELLSLLNKSEVSLVINIGSGMGVIPAPGRSAYCSMKFALRGMTLSLAEEFKRAKPHFVLLTLGSVLTGFGPMSLEEKKEEALKGKAYLTPEWVAERLVGIIKEGGRQTEYTFYPSEYKDEWEAVK